MATILSQSFTHIVDPVDRKVLVKVDAQLIIHCFTDVNCFLAILFYDLALALDNQPWLCRHGFQPWFSSYCFPPGNMPNRRIFLPTFVCLFVCYLKKMNRNS